jgi:UrcA family protein
MNTTTPRLAQSVACLATAIALIAAPAWSLAADLDLAPSRSLASQPVDGPAGVRVRFADLKLSKPEDVARLYARISRVARDICGPGAAAWDGRTSPMEKCIAQTIEDAVSRINSPPLIALHTAHRKRALGG